MGRSTSMAASDLLCQTGVAAWQELCIFVKMKISVDSVRLNGMQGSPARFSGIWKDCHFRGLLLSAGFLRKAPGVNYILMQKCGFHGSAMRFDIQFPLSSGGRIRTCVLVLET